MLAAFLGSKQSPRNKLWYVLFDSYAQDAKRAVGVQLSLEPKQRVHIHMPLLSSYYIQMGKQLENHQMSRDISTPPSNVFPFVGAVCLENALHGCTLPELLR